MRRSWSAGCDNLPDFGSSLTFFMGQTRFEKQVVSLVVVSVSWYVSHLSLPEALRGMKAACPSWRRALRLEAGRSPGCITL